MQFRLFSKIEFEIAYPIALIEGFCFHTNFYSSYDLLLPDRTIEDVSKIGARIDRDKLKDCKNIVADSINILIFNYNLDDFLKLNDMAIQNHVKEASKLINDLMNQGTGLSQALKILHTVYPKIMPMIDSMLQEQYQLHVDSQWKQDNPSKILFDYYINLKRSPNKKNLNDIYKAIHLPCLTKVRVFDIIWWSYLRSKKLQHKNKNIVFSTIN
jgi:hypothetical protein